MIPRWAVSENWPCYWLPVLFALAGAAGAVLAVLGHRDVATTQRYAHLLPGRRERAVSAAVAGLLDDGETRERDAG